MANRKKNNTMVVGWVGGKNKTDIFLIYDIDIPLLLRVVLNV